MIYNMVYIFLADGFEEIEALAPLDILRRGGVDVKTVGVTGEFVMGAHDITVKSDIDINSVDVSAIEAVFLPGGGKGTENLDASEKVKAIVLEAAKAGKLVCAICAAPSILGKMGLLKGKEATCYPGFEKYLEGADVKAAPVVQSGNFITSNGMGSAYKFGFSMLAALKDVETAEKIKKQIQY